MSHLQGTFIEKAILSRVPCTIHQLTSVSQNALLTISNCCNNFISWQCQIGCYDWDEHDTNDLIGCVDLTLRQLIDAKESGVCTYILIFFWSFCIWQWQINCFDYDDDGAVVTLLGQTALLLDSCLRQEKAMHGFQSAELSASLASAESKVHCATYQSPGWLPLCLYHQTDLSFLEKNAVNKLKVLSI